jgi:hypothetical protein
MIQLKFKKPLGAEHLLKLKQALPDHAVEQEGQIVRLGGEIMLSRVFSVLNQARIDAALLTVMKR